MILLRQPGGNGDFMMVLSLTNLMNPPIFFKAPVCPPRCLRGQATGLHKAAQALLKT